MAVQTKTAKKTTPMLENNCENVGKEMDRLGADVRRILQKLKGSCAFDNARWRETVDATAEALRNLEIAFTRLGHVAEDIDKGQNGRSEHEQGRRPMGNESVRVLGTLGIGIGVVGLDDKHIARVELEPHGQSEEDIRRTIGEVNRAVAERISTLTARQQVCEDDLMRIVRDIVFRHTRGRMFFMPLAKPLAALLRAS